MDGQTDTSVPARRQDTNRGVQGRVVRCPRGEGGASNARERSDARDEVDARDHPAAHERSVRSSRPNSTWWQSAAGCLPTSC